jgi:hypothetical protein
MGIPQRSGSIFFTVWARVGTVRFPVVHRVRTGQNTTMGIDGLLKAGLVAAVMGLLGSLIVIVWTALQNLN